MKYATWILNFDDPNYGTGPEASIAEQGGSAEASITNGDITQGATILGYFTGEPTNLEAWNFTEITQAEALAFAQEVDATAYLTDEGRIAFEIEEII